MDNFDFDYAINLYSQTDIFMTVLVKSVNQSPEYAYNIDVTKEINKLLQGNAESEDDDPAEILKKVLGDKGDYIDLVEANIIDIPVKIIPELPIAEFHIKLDFVIKANFAAGISSETTLLTARQIGIAGNSREGYLVTYDHELFGNNRYAIDIYAAGYVGFKTGLKGTMTISFFGLEDLGKLGTSLEFGAYIDLYGFAHATIRKTYPNDYIYSGKKGITLDGAIYMELGLYLETELFVESKTFSARAGLTVLDLKFPLLSVGDRYVLSKFLNNETHILMNTESLQLNSSNGLLAAEFIDLKTGEKVTGSFADPSKFAVGYSSPYLSTENNAININKTLLGSNIKRLDVTAYIYYNGSALTFTGPREIYFDINGQPYAIETPKTVKLTWIDSSIDASQFSGIDTAKATYVVNIDGKETVLYERTVLLAEIPGSIDLSSYMQSHKITGYDNDFNVPIIRDTIYKINMTPYQRLISYITYYDGEWHFEVYPLNSGEKPVPPAKYNSTPEMGFKEWFVASGYWGYTRGNYYFNEVIPMEAALRYGNDNVFVGLDTTKSLYSISGTLTDCYNAYYQGTYNGKSFNFLSLARYEAEYQQRENCTVTIRYPAMEYIVMGRTVKYGTSTWTNSYRFGGSIVIPSSYWFAYNGCEMLGWDTNGDGIVDYDPKNPPIAGSDMTFTAVMKVKTFDVTMQDHNGIPVGRVTVNIGNLPDILSTSPEHPDGDANKFMHWEVSKGGREFVKWDKWTNPGVYEGWTVRPVYSREFKVTFLNGSDISFTVLLPVGTYNASDYVWFTPTKDSDEDYYYNFSGWDSGDNFTVTGDMTITALFTPFPILYTIKFTTPYGELSTGGKTHTIMSTYGEYAEVAKAYIDANNTFEPVYTDDRVYTFTSWGPVEIDIIDRVGVTVEYTAIWSYEIRNYTITFDGGEGYYKSTGQKTYTINDFIYGTTASLFGEDSFVRDEDDYNTYVFTGWRDQLGVIHLPGATYTVTGDMTYTAVYGVLTEKTYTVTFDANGGVFPENPDIDFPEGESIITITCSYGYVITGIPEPTKAADSIYTYTFIGWEPDIVPVTGNAAYTAKYSRQYEVELPTGLKISDGTTTEDINMGTISGYTYTMEMNYYNVYVPTLTITGNGLTVSGIPDISGESWNLPDVVRIFITKEVTDVCFKGLTLWTDNDHLIYIEGEDGSEAITVTFSDKSSFYNYGAYDSGGYRYSFAPIESERDIVLISSDTEATLSLSTEAGASALICGGDATIRNLNLTINMRITQIDGISDNWGRFPAAFHNGKYEMSNWSFIDSVVTVDTDGRGFGSSGFGSIGTIDISGCQFSITSAFEYIESADNLIITNSNFNFLGKSRLGSWGEDNVLDTGASDGIISGTVLIQGKSYVSLIADVVEIAVLKTDLILFEDFMGTFEVSYLDPEITFLTVYTNSGIKFLIESNEVDPLDHYDLGGAKIGWVTAIDDPTYYTFVNDVDAPLSEVLIRQKELALKYLHQ
ncbi:MAG: InlB B-repeat-containing protein [Methanosarcinales archaeon]|nr:InlB B-repeat-containing protein [Methanosarcinales archaeon]